MSNRRTINTLCTPLYIICLHSHITMYMYQYHAYCNICLFIMFMLMYLVVANPFYIFYTFYMHMYAPAFITFIVYILYDSRNLWCLNYANTLCTLCTIFTWLYSLGQHPTSWTCSKIAWVWGWHGIDAPNIVDMPIAQDSFQNCLQ